MKYFKIIFLCIIVFFIGYYTRDLGLPFNYASQSLIRMNPVVKGKINELPIEMTNQLSKEDLDQLDNVISYSQFDLRIQYGPFFIFSNRNFTESRVFFMPEGHSKEGWYISQHTKNNTNSLSFMIFNSPNGVGLSVDRDATSSKPVSIGYNYGSTFYIDTDVDGKWNIIAGVNTDGKIYRYSSKDGLVWKSND